MTKIGRLKVLGLGELGNGVLKDAIDAQRKLEEERKIRMVGDVLQGMTKRAEHLLRQRQEEHKRLVTTKRELKKLAKAASYLNEKNDIMPLLKLISTHDFVIECQTRGVCAIKMGLECDKLMENYTPNKDNVVQIVPLPEEKEPD